MTKVLGTFQASQPSSRALPASFRDGRGCPGHPVPATVTKSDYCPKMSKPVTPSKSWQKVSESWQKVSESSQKVSESSQKVSESWQKVSESSQKVSESWQKVSESSQKVSEPARAHPSHACEVLPPYMSEVFFPVL